MHILEHNESKEEHFINDIFEKWSSKEIRHYLKLILWEHPIEQVETCWMERIHDTAENF